MPINFGKMMFPRYWENCKWVRLQSAFPKQLGFMRHCEHPGWVQGQHARNSSCNVFKTWNQLFLDCSIWSNYQNKQISTLNDTTKYFLLLCKKRLTYPNENNKMNFLMHLIQKMKNKISFVLLRKFGTTHAVSKK